MTETSDQGTKMGRQIPGRRADDANDPIGSRLRELAAIPHWNQAKQAAYDAAEAALVQAGYLPFTGDYRTYGLERRGDSCLVDVSDTQRGALRFFRGRTVRVVCAGAWDQYGGRYFFEGEVSVKSLPTKA